MRRTLDRFDRRLRAELHHEFDAQAVDTPAPHRARYGQVRQEGRGPVGFRTAALVTAVFAVGMLVGLVYDSRHPISPGPGHNLGVVPPGSPAASSTAGATPAPQTAAPSPGASTRPTGRPRPTAPRSAPPGAPSFADDFTADPLGASPPAGWQVGDGEWTGVVDDGGHVVRHDAAEPLGHLVAGSSRWSDYSVGADVSTELLDLGFAGVAGRYQDPGDDYECGVGGVAGQLQLWVVQGGQRRLLAASGASLGLLGSRHRVQLQMHGSQLTCSLDGVPLLQANDAAFAAGRIALVASDGEAAELGGVRVTG
jgi:hypothetical protein